MRTLLFDIETSPNIAYTWGKYEQTALAFVKERQIISVAWKWLGDKDAHVVTMSEFGSYKRNHDNNRGLVVLLHNLLNEADVVVGHNAISFDVKMARTEFLRHGLRPPSPFRIVDTLRLSKRFFRFNSNKQGDIGPELSLGSKLPTGGFQLWLDCLANDPKAWAKMAAYNKQDVILLEKIYLKLRPWIPVTPVVLAGDACYQCTGDLMKRGWAPVVRGRKRKYQCKDCGSWSTGVLEPNAA